MKKKFLNYQMVMKLKIQGGNLKKTMKDILKLGRLQMGYYKNILHQERLKLVI
jgi:hypothetical protein